VSAAGHQFVLTLAGSFLLLLVVIAILNADLRGRMTQNQVVKWSAQSASDEEPVVRIVVHRILSEENTVEASVILRVIADGPIGRDVKAGKTTLLVEVRDGSSLAPVELRAEARLDSSAFQPGFSSAAVQSPRFLLPAYESLGSYPLEELTVRPIVTVRETNTAGAVAANVEIQKSLSGRELHASGSMGNVEIRLSRTTTEVAYILTLGIIFFTLSVLIALNLIAARLSGLQELLAVAGYFLAAAGFRDVLGLSRVTSTTLFEIVALGVPLVALSASLAVSAYRDRRSQNGPEQGFPHAPSHLTSR
jgi:hypothetical protein